MEQENLKRMIDDQRRVLIIVWGSMMAALVIYLVIPPLVVPKGPRFAPGAFSLLLRTVFWFLVVVETLFLMWWKERHLKPRSLLVGLSSEAEISSSLSSAMSKRIIAFAIAESFAIYGLVLALIGQALWDQYVFTLVSAVLMIQLYPSVRFFEELVREYQLRGLEP